jgi:hypothetical protein
MNKLSLLAALTLCSCSAMQGGAPVQDGSAARNRLTVYFGQRSLDDGDYEPVDEQAAFGLEFARGGQESIGWEFGLMGSRDEDEILGVDVEATTGELYGGVRKEFGNSTVRPYVGGGVSFINSEVEVSGIGSADDTSVAGYLHAGVAFQLNDIIVLGLDLRGLFGSDLELAGFDTDADYTQFALFLGFNL